LRTSSHALSREPKAIPFSTAAMRANLLRLQNEWEKVQVSRDRSAIYAYLSAIFELVEWWNLEGDAVSRAHQALHLRGYSSVREPEPFAAVILCTSNPDKVDHRTQSKWSRVLRHAAEFKRLDEPLHEFIVRRAVSTHAQHGMLVAWDGTDNTVVAFRLPRLRSLSYRAR
jgi:hypothetical protein